jgi:hypothetical protein
MSLQWKLLKACIAHREYADFPKIYEPPQESRRYKVYIKQAEYWGRTNIGHLSTKMSRSGYMAPVICTFLRNINYKEKN